MGLFFPSFKTLNTFCIIDISRGSFYFWNMSLKVYLGRKKHLFLLPSKSLICSNFSSAETIKSNRIAGGVFFGWIGMIKQPMRGVLVHRQYANSKSFLHNMQSLQGLSWSHTVSLREGKVCFQICMFCYCDEYSMDDHAPFSSLLKYMYLILTRRKLHEKDDVSSF